MIGTLVRRAPASPFPAAFSAVLSLASIFLGLLGAGCRKPPDFEPYRREAAAFSEEAAPRHERLAGRLPALAKRAEGLAGHAAVYPEGTTIQDQVARNRQSAAFLGAAIEGLPAKIESAIKTGKPDEVERTLALSRAEIDTAISALRTALDATASDLARLERLAASGALPASAPSKNAATKGKGAPPPSTAAAAAAAGALSK